MRSWLEENGWMQGDFISPDDVILLRNEIHDFKVDNGDIYFIVASQSCDICASNENEPYIEFSIARELKNIDGNFMFNKNPRRLHLTANYCENSGATELYLELLIHEKFSILKSDIEKIKKIKPCENIKLTQTTIQQYANWLASRYNRPALPTKFEQLFNQQWKKSNREKASEKCSEYILGIYVDIHPDRDIIEGEVYEVQLLFLISHEIEDDKITKLKIEELAQKYVDNLREANMIIGEPIIVTQKQISLATFSKFKRFNLDSLSYKHKNDIAPNIN